MTRARANSDRFGPVIDEMPSAVAHVAAPYVWLVRAAVLAYAASCFAQFEADPDLWGHLRFGQEIWALGGVPATDAYSYTAPAHAWINHEWLAEALFWAIYAVAGSPGLLAFKLAVGLVIVHLLSSRYFAVERRPLAYAVHFTLLVYVLAPGFLVRPQLMTYLCLTLLMLALEAFFAGRRRALRWTPLIMLVWINSHGGVLAGLGLYGAAVAVEAVRTRGGRHGAWKPLVTYFLLSCLAVLVNPYGPDLVRFICASVFTPRDIDEWAPVRLFDTRHLAFKTMAVLFLATLAFPTRKRLWEVVAIGAATAYGLKHQRHTVLAAIVMTPYVALQWAEMLGRWARLGHWIRRRSPAFQAALGLVLTGFVLFEGGRVVHAHWRTSGRIVVETGVYPVRAVRFLAQNGIDGNVLVPFEWGEYVIWKRPGSRVSVDGRFDTVYPEAVLASSFDFTAGRDGWNRLIDDFPTEVILSRKTDHGHHLLTRHPGWQRIYDDPVAAVWIPATEPPSPLLARFRTSALVRDDAPPSPYFP